MLCEVWVLDFRNIGVQKFRSDISLQENCIYQNLHVVFAQEKIIIAVTITWHMRYLHVPYFLKYSPGLKLKPGQLTDPN